MSSILLEPLGHLQDLSQQFFLSLGPPQSKPPPAPPVSAFLEVDAALADAVQRTRAHQVRQRRIEALKAEILELENEWRGVVDSLEEGKRELEGIVKEGEERLIAIEDAKKGTLSDIMSYFYRGSSQSPVIVSVWCSCNSIPGATRIRAKSVRIHVCATEHARLDAAGPTASPALLPAIPQRGEDASWPHERRGSPWSTRRDSLRR